MAVLRDLLALRVNFVIVFGGAFLVIFLIKLTSLLPEKYYFNFSKIYGSDSSPFLVEPPSVTGKKLCRILRQNNIRLEDTSLQRVDCKDKAAADVQGLTRDQQDQVYDIALRTDSSARTHLRDAAARFQIKLLSQERFLQILRDGTSVPSVYENLKSEYAGQISDHMRQGFADRFGPGFGKIDLPADSGDKPASAVIETGSGKLPPDQQGAIFRAYQKVAGALQTTDYGAIPVKRITKSKIDDVLKSSYTGENVTYQLFDTYVEAYSAHIDGLFERAFKDAGVDIRQDNSTAKSKLFQEVIKGGWQNYLIAVLVRIIPVFLFGLALGIFFGAAEFVSISLAAAFAAFLLSWPVMLLWDQVTQGAWAGQKNMFLGFYLLYALSFYLTARLGAVLGAIIRRGLPQSWFAAQAGIGTRTHAELSSVGIRELVKSLVAGVAANLLFYVANAIIPFAVS